MPVDWKPFVQWVDQHERFVLTSHVRPDGDALGSVLALADVLRQRGKSARVVIASGVPERYDFLSPLGLVERFVAPGDAWADADALIVVDTGTWNQIGEFGPFMQGSAAAKVVIDHHHTQDDLGAMRFVDTSAEAAGRLVHEAIVALGEPLSPNAAQALFIALSTDTGWFRHSSATARTFELAADLVRAGARPHEAYEALYERSSLSASKLLGRVLDRLQSSEHGRICWTEITLADFVETGAHPNSTEDAINYTRRVRGVEVGLIFIEQVGGSVKVSFRSREAVDVARVAEQFGGGGHRLASGATVSGSLAEVRTRVLAAVQSALPPAP